MFIAGRIEFDLIHHQLTAGAVIQCIEFEGIEIGNADLLHQPLCLQLQQCLRRCMRIQKGVFPMN